MEAYTNDIIMQIRNLDVSYDGKLILHDISMDIRKNRITAIIGPSGCGKTTFLKTLNGLLQEERGAKVSGRISLEGTEIQQVSLETLRKNVGLVFQTGAFSVFHLQKPDLCAGLLWNPGQKEAGGDCRREAKAGRPL